MHSRFQRLFITGNTVVALLLLIFFFDSCSPTRRLKEDQYLLNRNKIRNNTSIIADNELLVYVRQKPNRKIAGFWRFHLQVYNLVNRDSFIPAYNKRLEIRIKENEIRQSQNKKLKNAEPVSIRKWFLKIGEAPVIIDTTLTLRSSRQLELYLKNHGYFNAKVRDSVILNPSTKTAEVIFTVDEGIPSKYKKVIYDIPDYTINGLFMSSLPESLIDTGNIYNAETLDDERERITLFLKDKGYYAFVKNYVTFNADTGSNEVDLTLHVNNPVKKIAGYEDSTLEVTHIRYRINEIYVNGDYQINPDSGNYTDTLYFDNIHYVSKGKLRFRPRAIKPAISLRRGDLYSKSIAERTYRRIADYNAFKFINLQFKPVSPDSSDLLNVEIQVSPKERQATTFQTRGTNTGGNLGISGDIIYQNRNLLRGLELFEVLLTGGFEVQQVVSENINQDNLFNTIVFGPQLSLQIPKIPAVFGFLGKYSPTTRITVAYNFQKRPDYTRSIFTLAYGYFARTKGRVVMTFNPAEINFVNVTLGQTFSDLLNASNNLFLRNSFKSQYISAARFTWTFNTQVVGASKSFTYLQWNLETAGGMLQASRKLFPAPAINADDHYLVFGVPYSQYLRGDFDFRHFRFITPTSSLGFRFITGLGIPYGNSSVMPFVKSFYVGGANSIRAWRARSLGPGSYSNPVVGKIDQIGDIKLEWNLEYRLKLYRIFEGAAFIDAGNIWLRQKDLERPNAEFDFNRFYKEIAVGTGVGLRLNFDFFIIRIDAAHPLREPSYAEGDRWSFKRVAMKNVIFNFGIGYPF